MNPIDQFRGAMLAAGLPAPDEIHGDGRLHRFSANGKRGDDSGWYVLHLDGVPAGAFGCWRHNIDERWCSKAQEAMSAAERTAYVRRLDAIRKQREEEGARRRQQAAQTARQRWQASATAAAHPYLTAKGVQAYGVKVDGDLLLIPMHGAPDEDGHTLHSLQTIAPDGSKRFLPGGRVKGCYHAIGQPEGLIVVCEGYATAASVHEATGHAVAVAFNAGNLLPVAQALRAKYPGLALLVAADDDWRTDGNPGMSKAREAAQAVGGRLAVPIFPPGRTDKDTDMNDLHRLAGLEAVRASIEAANPAAQALDPNAWPEPVPLPEELPPVEPFDAELLPESLRAWVADIAHRMQCPPDFPAIGALVALSSLIGARAVVAPKERDDWRVVPNLWGLVIGRPGVMKSPALAEVLKPLYALEKDELERWQEEHDAWELDRKVDEMAAKANEKEAARIAKKDRSSARTMLMREAPAAEPIARRYVVNDATVEKLGEILEQNSWGTLAYRDEMSGLLSSMDKQGQEGARSFYLQAYDGDKGYTIDRIGRGTHRIDRVCLALLGGIQPGMIQRYVREANGGGAGDDGLLQRLGLTVWPDVGREYRRIDQWPDKQAKQAARAVFERLNQLQPAEGEEGQQPQEWRFSQEAQEIFWEWSIPFETELRGDDLPPALVSHLSKYKKLVPALALLFAIIDSAAFQALLSSGQLNR